MWREHSDILLGNLSLRWLGSAAATYADLGGTVEERRTGLLAVAVLDVVKLYETERRCFLAPHPEGAVKGGAIFDGVVTYSIERGDLMDHMARRMEAIAIEDKAEDRHIPVTLILQEIWKRLQAEDTVFRRFRNARRDLEAVDLGSS